MTGPLPVRDKPHFTRERADALAAHNVALAAAHRFLGSPAMEEWVRTALTGLTGAPTYVSRSRSVLTLDDDELRGLLRSVREQRRRGDRSRPVGRHPAAAAPDRASSSPRLISLAAALLPGAQRDRWTEEWTAEWADLSERPAHTRWPYLCRLLLHGAPRLAWSARRVARRRPV
ncbi:hypothetical protein [Streptomyces sp. 135]|uniref:hypothetical protein n=1 Tax=Streptomyces sp. 135 TaxID=2838850 RepID=UPI001CBFBE77|nr:hypothetical protein [Streptomyces sp. 135]